MRKKPAKINGMNKTRNMMDDKILVRLEPELKQLIIEEADRLELFGGMGEAAARILAAHFKRPDLARVPRKRMGRPRRQPA